MKYIILILLVGLSGCATKKVCVNSNEGFRAVLDPERGCAVRIQQIIVGSDLDIPRSLSFRASKTRWGYRWEESKFTDGNLVLGHFVLVPLQGTEKH